MSYTIACYDIVRYEVYIYYKGMRSQNRKYFDTEERALNFINAYSKVHPDWSFKLVKVERAALTQE